MTEYTVRQVAEILGIRHRAAAARAERRGRGTLIETAAGSYWTFDDDDLAALRAPMRRGAKVRSG